MKYVNCVCDDIINRNVIRLKEFGLDIAISQIDDVKIDIKTARSKNLKKSIEGLVRYIENQKRVTKKAANSFKGKINEIYNYYYSSLFITYSKQFESLNELLENTNFEDLSFEEYCEVINKSITIRTMVYDEEGNIIDHSVDDCLLLAKSVGFDVNTRYKIPQIKNKVIENMSKCIKDNNKNALELLQAGFTVEKLSLLSNLEKNLYEFETFLIDQIDKIDLDFSPEHQVKVLKK